MLLSEFPSRIPFITLYSLNLFETRKQNPSASAQISLCLSPVSVYFILFLSAPSLCTTWILETVRASSHRAVLATKSTTHASTQSQLSPTCQTHHHHHLNSTTFDPLLNYFDPNSEQMWTKTLRSDFSNSTYSSFPLPSSGALFSSSASPTIPFETTHTDPIQTPIIQNAKKRSRASRRAPTTVLTTDTANFRAMVQEFTGIPPPPFPRTRLDLFSSPSTTISSPLADALQPPPYLLRPFAQNFQPPPVLSPNINDVGSGNSGGSLNYVSNFQMQNQILTFPSLLQSPIANSSILRSSAQGNDNIDPTVWGGGDQSHQLRPVNGNYVQ